MNVFQIIEQQTQLASQLRFSKNEITPARADFFATRIESLTGELRTIAEQSMVSGVTPTTAKVAPVPPAEVLAVVEPTAPIIPVEPLVAVVPAEDLPPMTLGAADVAITESGASI